MATPFPLTGGSDVRVLWDGERQKIVYRGLETLTLDGCARPVAWTFQGRQFRRGLDGRFLEIVRIFPPAGEDHSLFEGVTLTPQEGEENLQGWLCRFPVGLELESWLESLRADAERFRQLYGTVSILPPDQYRSLLLNLTEGCRYNHCNFCQLYRDRSYRVRSESEFAEHITQVTDYFGPALSWRRGLFLGEANAAGVSTTALAHALAVLGRHLAPGERRQFDRCSAFLDCFTGPLRSPEDWRDLALLGLHQVHLGVESGSAEVLGLLGKPVQAERLEELVRRLRLAGIAVSLIFLLGAGGQEYARVHLQETVDLLRRLSPQVGDRVYLSDLLVHPNSDYARLKLTPLTRWQCRQQARDLRHALNWPPPPRGPMVTLYDVRQFVYN